MNAINEELNLGKSDDDQFDIDKSNKSEWFFNFIDLTMYFRLRD